MFDRREQTALLLLAGILLVGSGLSLFDYYRPVALEEFQVIPVAVQVPVPVETPSGEEAAGEGQVDLNAATAVQLQALPAIGPKMAARILAYRRKHGPFRRLEELQQVPGIGPRTLEKLRPLITCGD
jgi:competence protein ComEA